jgi:site-specific DNA-methyltransferase (adenine-specific)
MSVNANIIYGDCIEELGNIDTNSIDHIISDWPFYKVVKEDWDNQWSTEVEYLDWCRRIIVEYKRIIKDGGNIIIFTGRQYNRKISTILDEFFNEKRIIIWARKRAFNNTRGTALASGYEPICYYTNGSGGTFNNIKIKPKTDRKEYYTGILKDGITMSDVWSDIPALPHNSREKLKHPTQKPYQLIERLVKLFTNEGDIILDNFAGSGTLGDVCINNNRNCILIENNIEYIEIINKRLNKNSNNFWE